MSAYVINNAANSTNKRNDIKEVFTEISSVFGSINVAYQLNHIQVSSANQHGVIEYRSTALNPPLLFL